MNQYAMLRKKQQEEVNDLPLEFAFSNEQFDEMMKKWGLDPQKDIEKICSMPDGGFFQMKDIERIRSTFRRHKAEFKNAIAEDATGDGFICQMFYTELCNHEYGYTGDYEDTLEALGYTWEQVQADKRLKHGLDKAAEKIRKDEGGIW